MSNNEPIADLDTGSSHDKPDAGVGLCLSGGGYRAMLFHLGALWRLNELGYFAELKRISSVSGGSITAALLGMKWTQVEAGGIQAYIREVVEPIRILARHTIDVDAILIGGIGPGSVSDRVIRAYRKHLFGTGTLQDLPNSPRFVINATNVQSGALWRFMKPYMRDYRVGEILKPEVELAVAVAASSAFPPFLSPLTLDLDSRAFTPKSGMDLQFEPYTSEAILTDGGVYDNLGLETVWKRFNTVLVSDGGGKMAAEPSPKHDWARHARRVMDLVDNQVRSLRKRQLIDSFTANTRSGAYWGIRTDLAEYPASTNLPCPHAKTMQLAHVPTRLKALDEVTQERLVNWGYAVCDTAVRAHVDDKLPMAAQFPYPGAGVG